MTDQDEVLLKEKAIENFNMPKEKLP